MQILYNNEIINIVATETIDTNYPVTNLFNQHIKKGCKAASTGDLTLTFTICDPSLSPPGVDVTPLTYESNAFTLFNIQNATYASFTLQQGETVYMQLTDKTSEGGLDERIDLTGIQDYHHLIRGQGVPLKALWVDYVDQLQDPLFLYEPHTITIKLEQAEDAIEPIACGVARAGVSYEFVNPIYGINEELKDLSIEEEYNNGAFYYKDLGRARTFKGSLNVKRDRAFYEFLYNIAHPLGKKAIAWKVVNGANLDWLIYGRLSNMPQGSHENFIFSTIDFEITEAI